MALSLATILNRLAKGEDPFTYSRTKSFAKIKVRKKLWRAKRRDKKI